MYKKTLYIILFLFLISLLDAEAQCAMCRAVLESDEDTSKAEGINKGIVYLMAFPYILVSIIGFIIYKNRQKLKELDSK